MCRTGYAYVCPGNVMRTKTPQTNCTPWSHTFLSPRAKVNEQQPYAFSSYVCSKTNHSPLFTQVSRQSMLMKTKDLSLCEWNKSNKWTMACVSLFQLLLLSLLWDVFFFLLINMSCVLSFFCKCTKNLI